MDPAVLSNMTEAQQIEAQAAAIYGADIDMSLGPYLMGYAIDLFFCGILIAQFARWYGKSHDESRWTKFVVYSSLIISFAYTFYALHYNMQNWVYHFGEYSSFAKLSKSIIFVIDVVVISLITQIFYAERSYRMLGRQRNILRNVFLVSVTFSMVVQLGGALAGVIVCYTEVKVLFDGHKVQPFVYTWLVGQLASDILVTGMSAWILLKSKTGWSATDKVINKLITFSVETSLPPTVIYGMCKPSVIALLALLNGKEAMRQEINALHTSGTEPFILTETYTFTEPPLELQLQNGLNKRARKSDEFIELSDRDFKDTTHEYPPSPSASKSEVLLGRSTRTRFTSN